MYIIKNNTAWFYYNSRLATEYNVILKSASFQRLNLHVTYSINNRDKLFAVIKYTNAITKIRVKH